MIPSPVAERMIATSSGERTRSAARRPRPITSAIPNETSVAEPGQSQQPSAQPVEVDLESGEQQQEREPDHGEHLHRLVVRGPAEHLRADDDPEQDLEHDRRQSQSGERDRERREHGDDGDHGDRRERDRHAALDREAGVHRLRPHVYGRL